MNADVHERVDGGNKKEWHEEAVNLAEDVTKDPLPPDDGNQGHWHEQDGCEQVGDGQVTQEHVGACPHAAMTPYHQDHHGVAKDGTHHEGHHGG